ncbi:hypothetical protein EWM64_g5823 [Hericium alpestre]|uniref:Extracellular metalloproteinase n=1 Tax=Hericium alpestre TaxID=135208 RepID=A0A4Y9ZTF6_9AGAM|nr:hypothetical protein EWM64_g5823 [Hericium alpestre]
MIFTDASPLTNNELYSFLPTFSPITSCSDPWPSRASSPLFPPPSPESSDSDSRAEAQGYINNTVTQLFYTTNLVHDLYYRYGFDEVSGNFQQHNFGRGGAEGDAVIANAQDGSGYNNANFMTPPDGQNGRCRMYLWNTASPYRDGDLEAGIVIHELSHGLSTRLTGGPANSGCLGWGESGGMGEGWGDFLASTIRSNKVYSDYPMGAWAANQEGGIRNYPYSLNNTVNPSTYKTLDKPGYWGVHAIGEVWAQMLWVVSQRLIEKHGFTDSLFPPAPLADGTVPEGDFYHTRTDASKPLVPKRRELARAAAGAERDEAAAVPAVVLRRARRDHPGGRGADERGECVRAVERVRGAWAGEECAGRWAHAVGWRCPEGWVQGPRGLRRGRRARGADTRPWGAGRRRARLALGVSHGHPTFI